MKYCTKCGAQMLDEAVLCVTCGSMVEGAFANGTATVARVPRPKKEKRVTDGITVLEIFSFIHSALSMLSAFFILLSWIFNYTYTSYYGTVGVVPNFGCIVTALIVGALSVGAGITCSILSIRGREKVKEQLHSVLKLFASLLLTVLALLGLIYTLS